MAFNDLFNKIKGYATQNPQKAQQALDKVEQTVNDKTGGKYSDKLSKAGDAASKGLGLDQNQQGKQGDAGQVGQGGGQAPEAGQQQAPEQGQAPGQQG